MNPIQEFLGTQLGTIINSNMGVVIVLILLAGVTAMFTMVWQTRGIMTKVDTLNVRLSELSIKIQASIDLQEVKITVMQREIDDLKTSHQHPLEYHINPRVST